MFLCKHWCCSSTLSSFQLCNALVIHCGAIQVPSMMARDMLAKMLHDIHPRLHEPVCFEFGHVMCTCTTSEPINAPAEADYMHTPTLWCLPLEGWKHLRGERHSHRPQRFTSPLRLHSRLHRHNVVLSLGG